MRLWSFRGRVEAAKAAAAENADPWRFPLERARGKVDFYDGLDRVSSQTLFRGWVGCRVFARNHGKLDSERQQMDGADRWRRQQDFRLSEQPIDPTDCRPRAMAASGQADLHLSGEAAQPV